MALEAADWSGFAARKREAAQGGRLYGRGLACYVEVTGSANLSEAVEVTVTGDGKVIVVSGTQPMGQGLWTSYAQIVAERLGVAPEAVVVVQGDTAVVKTGGGSGGSRSLQVGGGAVLAGANAAIEAGRKLAAGALEAAEGDLEFRAEGLRDGGGRDRARARNGESAPPHRGRRHRPGDEPADRAWSDPGRDRPGHRPGAHRAHRPRPGDRSAPHRLVHGLRDAARRRRAAA